MPAKKAAARKPSDVDKFLADLALGRMDDRLEDLFLGFVSRLSNAGGAVRWRLTWDGLVVDEENLTLLECETAEQLAGKTWLTLSTRSAHDCVSILSAALVHRRGLSVVEARDALAGLTVAEVAGVVRSEYLAVPDPFVSASGPPDGS